VCQPKVLFAQDGQNRHVAIKIVRANSDEYRILRFLKEQNLETLQESCVIPVLDLLPADGFWLAVMPRSGAPCFLSKNLRVPEFVLQKVGNLNNLSKAPICARNSRHYAIYAQGEPFTGYNIFAGLNSLQGLIYLHEHNIVHRVRVHRFIPSTVIYFL